MKNQRKATAVTPMTSPAGAVPQFGQMPSLDHHRNRGPERRGSWRGGSLRQMGGVGMLQRHAEDFGLSEKQMDKLEAMRVDFELEKVDLRAAARKAKIRLRSSMRQEECVEKDVMAAIDEVARCEAELRKMAYRHLQSARAVLNDGQRKKVKTFRRKQECQKVQKWRRQMHGMPSAS